MSAVGGSMPGQDLAHRSTVDVICSREPFHGATGEIGSNKLCLIRRAEVNLVFSSGG